MTNNETILEVQHLTTAFDTEEGRLRAVDDVSFKLQRGTVLGLVGESGCGKSVTAFSIMRLLPKPSGIIESGSILLNGQDLVSLPPEEMQRIRGKRIAMIFQEPMTALNPVHRIGRQLQEVFDLHRPELTDTEKYREALALLNKVGIADSERRMQEYAHQISGGMRQRVMIAMALAGKPDVLIADEPTTALDVTIQAQILELMLSLQKETDMAIIFITHALGVIAEVCHEVLVMYAGWIVESAPVETLFADPKHPYTQGLLSSIPRLENQPKTELPIIKGVVPGLTEMPEGCRFQNRCPQVMDVCRRHIPVAGSVGEKHWARCFLYESVKPVQKDI